MANLKPDDPTAVDRSPKVSVLISKYPTSNATEYTEIKEYSYDSDVLSLGDPYIVSIANIDGRFAGKIDVGYTLILFVEDPNVNDSKTKKLTGIVTEIDYTSDMTAGDQIMIKGADLGWHLANNPGKLWYNFRGKTMSNLLRTVLDETWNIGGPRQGNELNRKLKLGRAGIQNPSAKFDPYLPPIMFEPGQMISEALTNFARREKLLINMSADGILQFFTPVTTANFTPLQVLHYHKTTESNRVLNNVQSARVTTKLDGVFTEVTCVGQVAYPVQFNNSVPNPNEGKFRGYYAPPGKLSILPFNRTMTFSDGDILNKKMATARAQWKWQRGQFDSWSAQYMVYGHSQKGYFYETDTIIEVHDSVNGVDGNFYVSGVRYNRTMKQGTTTLITIRKPDVLGA